MFGTAASLAGIQNSVKASMRNWATNSQTRLSTSGIDANRPTRMMSTPTMVLRRSKRSANAPANGPSTIAGSSRNNSTPPRAKLAAANPLTSEVAVAVMASRPSQSPKLDSAIDIQSRRKSRTCNTARSLPIRPTASDPVGCAGSATDPSAGSPPAACAPSGAGVGTAAGTAAVPGDGSPSSGIMIRSTADTPDPSSGDGAGGSGSDEMGAPGVVGWGRSGPWGASRYREAPTFPASSGHDAP